MPYAYSLVGWAWGLGLTAAVAAVETLTLCTLCAFAEQTKAHSYSDLVHKTLGPAAGAGLAVVLYIYLLLSCTAYLIIAADCLCPLLAGGGGGGAWWAGRHAVVAAVGLGVALPLSLPRTLEALSSVSAAKVYAILFVVGAVVWRAGGAVEGGGASWGALQASALGDAAGWQGLAVALPILAFGFQCHTAVIDLWVELEDEPFFLPHPKQGGGGGSSGSSGRKGRGGSSSSGSRGGLSPKLRGMAGVGVASLGTMAGFYGVMGLAGYLAFPSGADSNIMNGFPAADPLMQVARALVGLIVIAAFPVNHVPARSAILDLLAQLGGGSSSRSSKGGSGSSSRGSRSRDGSSSTSAAGSGGAELPAWAFAAETVAFCGVATAIALSVSDLGTMFQLVGGTAAAVLIFGIPGALLLHEAAAGAPAAAAPPTAATGAAAAADGGRRRALWAGGAALEAVTLASWCVTLYNLTSRQ